MSSKRNFFAMLLVALLTVTLLPYAVVQAQTRTLIVPDQYQNIQAAIDSANAGDTVFVKAGTYALNSQILINKPLSLIGENATTTIIFDQQPIPWGGDSIKIMADNVTVSGFTIQNYDIGILVGLSKAGPHSPSNTPVNCSIQGNKLLNGNYGVWVEAGIGFSIANNTILNNREMGIYLFPTAFNGTVTENYMSGNGWEKQAESRCAIGLLYAKNITIADNNLTANYVGIDLQFTTDHNIHGNNILNNEEAGLYFSWFSGRSSVFENNFTGNAAAIKFRGIFDPAHSDYRSFNYSNNLVYRNNFVDNSKQVAFYFPDSGYNITDVVSWDNGGVGNFWSDYQSRYPNATEIGNSGIGSLPYVIDANNTDYYPLLNLVDNTAPRIGVLSPESKNYTSNSISLDFMVDERTSQIVYSLDGQQNVTVTGNVTLSGLEAGMHNITIYALDAFGNVGASETVMFNVAEPFPILLFVAVTAVLAVVIGVLGLSFFRWRRKSSKAADSV